MRDETCACTPCDFTIYGVALNADWRFEGIAEHRVRQTGKPNPTRTVSRHWLGIIFDNNRDSADWSGRMNGAEAARMVRS